MATTTTEQTTTVEAEMLAALEAARARRRFENGILAEAHEAEEYARECVLEGTAELLDYGVIKDERICLEWLLGRRAELPDRLAEQLLLTPPFPGSDGTWPMPQRPRAPIARSPRRRSEQLPLPWPKQRKCNPFPRAETHNQDALRSQIRRERDVTPLEVVAAQAERPRTRGDCKEGLRPCPWMSCRHHNGFEVNPENGSLKEMYPHLRILSDPEGDGLDKLEAAHGTCSLDAADKNDTPEFELHGVRVPAGVGGLLRLRQVAASGDPIGITDGMLLEEVAAVIGQSYEQVREVGSNGLQNVRVALLRENKPRVPKHLVAGALVPASASDMRHVAEYLDDTEEDAGKARSCARPGCDGEATIAGVTCSDHWMAVPRTLRLEMWAAWPSWSEQQEAARAALQEESESMDVHQVAERCQAKGEGAAAGMQCGREAGHPPDWGHVFEGAQVEGDPHHPPAVVDPRQMGLFGGGGAE